MRSLNNVMAKQLLRSLEENNNGCGKLTATEWNLLRGRWQNLFSSIPATFEEVERKNAARGTPGPGKVRDNAGIYVDANRVLPGGITAGEFFQMSPAGQQNYRNQRLERGAGQVDQYLFNEVLGLPVLRRIGRPKGGFPSGVGQSFVSDPESCCLHG